jgi:hypothetical protein
VLRLITSRARLTVALGLVVAGVAIAVSVTTGMSTTANRPAHTPARHTPARHTPAARIPARTSAARTSARTSPRQAAAAYPAALTGLACRTLTRCLAVGANAPQMAIELIAERWNGSRWSRSTMPKPAGTVEVAPGAVACPAERACVAVGVGYPRAGSGSFAIAEHWYGRRWTAASAVQPGSSSLLDAVSCPSPRSCYAAGQYTPKGSSAWVPLIEHWNGTRWTRQAAPVPPGTSYGWLSDVSCPTARFCVAAGTDGAGELIERWNGRRWSGSVPRSARPAMLYGVSCASAASCFAVGTDEASSGSALVERWKNGRWTESSIPVPSGSSSPWLQSVSCVSATRCLAVGDDLNPGVYADAWNGTGWRLVRMTASGGPLGELNQVRCLAATSCVALADTTQTSATQRSESAFWNGTRWKVTPAA